MDYQINEEVIHNGRKVIIKQVYGDGNLQIEINGELKDVYYNEIQGQKPIKVKFLGRITYHQPGTISESLLPYVVG